MDTQCHGKWQTGNSYADDVCPAGSRLTVTMPTLPVMDGIPDTHYVGSMIWAYIVPNLLIGTRSGLTAALVVIMLLAAARQAPAAMTAGTGSHGGTGHETASHAGHGGHARRKPTAAVWLGVLAAVTLSGSFAGVLAFSGGLRSGPAQQTVSGLASVLAVVLATAMIVRVGRTAASVAGSPPDEGARPAAVSAGALGLTAFLAASAGGLATTSVLWPAARTSGHTAELLPSAAAGLAAGVVACWPLYRRVARLNASAILNRTALAVAVISAGVLAYGLGQLQGAALLAGERWTAFNLTAHARPGAWWVALLTGVTSLSPAMTVLQVVAWLAYLAVVIPAFARARPPGSAPRAAGLTAAGRWERLAGRRPWAVAGVLVAGPAVAAGATIAVLPAANSEPATVIVTRTACAPGWTSAAAGTHTFTVDNESGLPGEINLDDSSGDIAGEIETLGPGTSAPLTAILGSGIYVFKCFMGSQPATASAPVQVISEGKAAASSPATGNPIPFKPATVAELTGPNRQYQAYAAGQLADLAQVVNRIRADLRENDMAAARRDWLTGQLDWERVGASYDSFGPLGLAVDGLPDGLRGGVSDEHFTGLHRLEYGLWHGQSAATLLPVAATLASNVAAVQRNLSSQELAGDPQNLPIRAHEILEDALRDHLSGLDDQGAGAAFAETYADVQVTQAVLGFLAPLINARQPGLPEVAAGQLSILQQALLATRVHGQWESTGSASVTARESVDAAIDAALETLDAVPDLLEVPPAH
jgi:high-affinity iron transporter